MDIKSKIEQDGYVVVPNVLDEGEVMRVRRTCQRHLNREGRYFGYGLVQPNAAIHMGELEWIFHHEKIIEAFREVLGQRDIVFTGHCDAHLNIMGGWHKDDGGGRYLKGDYFASEDCRIYKVGIYLQDHPEENGLYVRRGSHRASSKTRGEVEHCSVRAGDIVIFDVRLTHRGQQPDPLMRQFRRVWHHLPVLNRHGRLFYRLRRAVDWMRGENLEDRVSVFFTFGAPNDLTEYFFRENMRRQNEQIGNTRATLPPALVERLSEKEVRTARFN